MPEKNEVKNKITNVTNLATTTTDLTVAENKIPNVSNLLKKTEFNTKTSEIENKITTDYDHDKCITTREFNMLNVENFTARVPQANLANKSDVANFLKKTDFNKLNEL